MKEETNLKKHLDSCKEYQGPRRSAIVDKQETIEEAAASYGNIKHPIPYGYVGPANDFINGAKWQQERSYSEEEVLELLHSRMRYTLGEDYKEVTTIDWFEQFKKK
jgi:hypothetical protein